MKKWKKVSSKVLLDHPRMKITQDTVKLPNGEIKEWPYWDSTDSAMMVGMTEDRKLIMIRQFRYLVGDEVVEFPSGALHESESVEEGLIREFEEETGYQAVKFQKLCSVYETYGQLNRKIHIYFAPNVKKTTQRLDRGEEGYEDIKVELIEFEEAVNLSAENKIEAMGSSLAILILKEKVERGEIKIPWQGGRFSATKKEKQV